jgi:hypothetical protein
MMARELTTSWRVDYEIVADKDTADRIYAVAEELSGTSTDGISKGQFESLLNDALSIATGESVRVSTTHTTEKQSVSGGAQTTTEVERQDAEDTGPDPSDPDAQSLTLSGSMRGFGSAAHGAITACIGVLIREY